MTVTPIKQYYQLGDEITCWTDAFEPPFFTWYNVLTPNVIVSYWSSFVVDETFLGVTISMQCLAINYYGNETYTIDVTVRGRFRYCQQVAVQVGHENV